MAIVLSSAVTEEVLGGGGGGSLTMKLTAVEAATPRSFASVGCGYGYAGGGGGGGGVEFDIEDSDEDDEDCESEEGEGEGQERTRFALRGDQTATSNSNSNKYCIVPTSGRRIAGSRRVASYRNHGRPSGAGLGEVMHSITATPSFANTSFEEMRTECYKQAMVATGTWPRAVDPAKTPWEVLPPIFNAFRGGEVSCVDGEVVMEDARAGGGMARIFQSEKACS